MRSFLKKAPKKFNIINFRYILRSIFLTDDYVPIISTVKNGRISYIYALVIYFYILQNYKPTSEK